MVREGREVVREGMLGVEEKVGGRRKYGGRNGD